MDKETNMHDCTSYMTIYNTDFCLSVLDWIYNVNVFCYIFDQFLVFMQDLSPINDEIDRTCISFMS